MLHIYSTMHAINLKQSWNQKTNAPCSVLHFLGSRAVHHMPAFTCICSQCIFDIFYSILHVFNKDELRVGTM